MYYSQGPLHPSTSLVTHTPLATITQLTTLLTNLTYPSLPNLSQMQCCQLLPPHCTEIKEMSTKKWE